MFSVTGSDRKFFFVLFRVVVVILFVFVLAFFLISCAFVPAADASDSSIVSASFGTVGQFSDSHNTVDVWVDPDTGVNYLLFVWHDVKTGGMCPRYNADGSLMVSGAEVE